MKRKIIPKQKFRTYAEFPLTSGDVRAYEIQLDLGQDVEDAEFKVVAIRADGKAIEDLGMVENGVATYTIANSMYAVPGELTLRLQIVHNSSVLTDREVIFEVLEGTQNTSQGSTVVPLNDSVILRLSSLEDKVEGKVDKISGKGLSQNDFTNEYKQKLDSLDETIGARLEEVSEDVDNLSDEVSEHKTSLTNPHKVTAEQVGAYTKTEVDTKLDKKANKEDIVNAYRFCGSVETFEDLNTTNVIKLIPDDAPMLGEEVWGSFDQGTGIVTINEYNKAVDITIPVKEITLEAGYYAVVSDLISNINFSSGILKYAPICETVVPHGYVFKLEEALTINQAYVFNLNNTTFSGAEGSVVCSFIKVNDEFVDNTPIETGFAFPIYKQINTDSPQFANGDVYNVLDTGMNYAWNGTEWDALGGEHKDLEARADIEELSNELADMNVSTSNINTSHLEGNGTGGTIKGFRILSVDTDSYKTYKNGDYTEKIQTIKVYLDSIQGIAVSSPYPVYGIFGFDSNGEADRLHRGIIVGVGTDDEGSYVVLQDNCFSGSLTTIKTNLELETNQGYAENSIVMSLIIEGGTIGSFDVIDDLNCFSQHAEGYRTTAGLTAHAENNETQALGFASHAEGHKTLALGERTHTEGYKTKAIGNETHAEGNTTEAHGEGSHTEGVRTIALGAFSHAKGESTHANGKYSHAEGEITEANNRGAHAEGYETKANGEHSHAEGRITEANGNFSHAEGYYTKANARHSHAEGYGSATNGEHSHAEGYHANAKGDCSHAEGYETIAGSSNQHVQGKYNIEDTENRYLHIVGNGSDDNGGRSNAHTIDWDGIGWYKGGIRVGGNNQDDAIDIVAELEKIASVGKSGEGLHSVIFNKNDTNSASGYASFTAGANNQTTKDYGATFGQGHKNKGQCAFVAGANNTVEGHCDIALGSNINIADEFGFGLGSYLNINKWNQTALGTYNEADGNAVFLVGCGKSETERKNAISVHSYNGRTSIHQGLTVNKGLTVNGKVTNTIGFNITGDITNQDGTVVATYADGKAYFNNVSVRNCTTLNIPIEPVTLYGTYSKAGIYSSSTQSLKEYLISNKFYVNCIPEGADGVVIETDDSYIVTKPLEINNICLKTDITPANNVFVGNLLSVAVTLISDTTASDISAATEYKEADGVSTSLRLTSPNGTVFKLTVADDGSLTTTRV